MIEVRLSRRLYADMRSDLARRHAFAGERVGFVFGRVGKLADGSALILLTRYLSIPDEHYIDDPTVGARIGTEALTAATHGIYHGRARAEGVFHVHVHEHVGKTGMSNTDKAELPKMIPGFRSVGREAPHGIIVWSLDHAAAWVWLPGEVEPVRADKTSVIGAPVSVFLEGAIR